MKTGSDSCAIVRAGVSAVNKSLYHRLRFSAVDPCVIIDLPGSESARDSVLIIRDIEMERAKKHARAGKVFCPADFTPAGGLSGDREIATAQSAAEYLKRNSITRVVADRTIPFLYVDLIRRAGIDVTCDDMLGVMDRRAKDSQEIQYLKQAQRDTESAVRRACEIICRAGVRRDGVLLHEGSELTSERLRAIVDAHLSQLGYANPDCILAGGAIGADCHHPGAGVLRVSEPVIVDIFPMSKQSLYWGDCTRTAVNGDVPEIVQKMHQIVCAAKKAATQVVRAGATGQQVHDATKQVFHAHGCTIGFAQNDSDIFCPHGTGHGVGLDVHEPPLLADGGPELIVGDVLTIEPALYSRSIGGVRVEDMIVTTESGCENLNSLPEGLDWR